MGGDNSDTRRSALVQGASAHYLEVQVQDVHLVHEEDPVTDLPDEHHGVHFSQLVVLVHDPLKELAALDAVCTDPPADRLQAAGPAAQPQLPHQALTTP